MGGARPRRFAPTPAAPAEETMHDQNRTIVPRRSRRLPLQDRGGRNHRRGVLDHHREYQKVWGADLCRQVNQRGFLVMGSVNPALDRGCHRSRLNATPRFLVLPIYRHRMVRQAPGISTLCQWVHNRVRQPFGGEDRILLLARPRHQYSQRGYRVTADAPTLPVTRLRKLTWLQPNTPPARWRRATKPFAAGDKL